MAVLRRREGNWMCPDPEMQLKDAFLVRLQSAAGFGFQLGRLALEWRLASGEAGVLLFDSAEPAA